MRPKIAGRWTHEIAGVMAAKSCWEWFDSTMGELQVRASWEDAGQVADGLRPQVGLEHR